MENWSRLMDAGRELSMAFDLLDRAAEITTISTAAVLTKEGLLGAARQAVARTNSLLGRKPW
ncbi:hypothetical protein [Paramagnetospirillum magneticum]|uniref:hypothetical protein n=1 Tax=Paramagnetospirillum magneticum TaxID=84159 RepID=UPI00030F4A3E|nr:hypothetical protein [Paramagnetospirillum magneticum]